jgi:hypothetical protein
MSTKIRPYRTGGWEVDITVRLPNGSSSATTEEKVVWTVAVQDCFLIERLNNARLR